MVIFGSIIIICGLLLLGVSVYIAFGAVLLFLAYTGGYDITGYLPAGYWKMNTLVLLAIPLFMIAGKIMEKGQIAAPLVSLAELFIGHIKGGLSAASVIASGVFGSISGSANATLTCIGGIMMPHLRKANYPDGLSAALIVSASPLGLLIPPSSSHILYAWVAQQSVLKAFLSTVIPGIILILLLIITNQFALRKYSDIKITDRPKDFRPKFKLQARQAMPALIMPLIILGGIYGGIMTPTEAAGVAVIYAIPIAIYVYRGLTWRGLVNALTESRHHHRHRHDDDLLGVDCQSFPDLRGYPGYRPGHGLFGVGKPDRDPLDGQFGDDPDWHVNGRYFRSVVIDAFAIADCSKCRR